VWLEYIEKRRLQRRLALCLIDLIGRVIGIFSLRCEKFNSSKNHSKMNRGMEKGPNDHNGFTSAIGRVESETLIARLYGEVIAGSEIRICIGDTSVIEDL
jgi:hypothetical protein